MSNRQGQASAPAAPLTSDTVSVALPCVMVIFGAGGNLTRCKVIPALYNLVASRRLPARLANYRAGSDGRTAADQLLTRSGRAWRPLT